jgi:tetratricopeptide (TPR) repeat protein
MIFRCLPFLVLLLGLAGCLPKPAVPATLASTLSPERAYTSALTSPEAKSLFYFSRSRLLAETGDLDAAAESLLQAIELDPGSAFLRLSLAELYLSQDEEEKALRAAEDALIQNPASVEANYLLGRIYFDRGDDAKAADHLQRVVEADPEQYGARLHLGIAYARSGQLDRAVEAFKDLLRRKPDYILGHLALARLYREMDLGVLAEHTYR